MKISRSQILFVLFATLLCSASVYAHHSFAEFDDKATVTIQGVVKEFRLVNPHAMLFFEATDPDGKTVQWEVQFDGRTHVGRAGWTDDTFKPMEAITVTGNPARSGSPYLFFISAIKGDGAKLTRPYNDSFENAEAEREQRRQSREK
jgi:Family of unknown function (DUF6152)